MGSVKDLKIIKVPEERNSGVGEFNFSDRYSVFDWGEMPDHIENKGHSLCITSAYFFEQLEKSGVKTHYSGVIENGEVKKLSELNNPSNSIEVKLVRVLKPEIIESEYNYDIYKTEKVNFLLPLEIIYRNSLPEGSSVFRRLKEGSLKLQDIGFNEMPEVGEVLKTPILDVSTKLEESDRYLRWNEAKVMAGLNEKELAEIKKFALLVNGIITREVNKVGLNNEDGKLELGFDENRNFIVVDAIGTLDECRFTYDGIAVSKEIARIFYRKTDWFREIEEAKRKDKINWKSLVKMAPPKLPYRLKELISMLYCAFCNEVTGMEWFEGVPTIKDIIMEIREII